MTSLKLKSLLWLFSLIQLFHNSLSCGHCTIGNPMACPDNTDLEFEVSVQNTRTSEVYMEIYCLLNNANFNLLEGCNFSSVDTVKFHICPFPNNSFANLFRTMGVTPSKIEYLTVLHPLISNKSLNSGHLDGLTNLTFLNLEAGKIEAIDSDVFVSTPNLKTLHLRGNNLTTLGVSLFEPLHNLTFLNLSHNNITTISQGLFNNLPYLKYLSFSRNNIGTLPAHIFDKLESLENILFSSNKLTALNEDLFLRNPKLSSVNFKKNRLTVLPEGLLRNCFNLSKVIFSHNGIEYIPEAFFPLNTNLSEINFQSNSLKSLSDSVFNNLPLLTKVDLSKNHLKFLPQNLFKMNKLINSIDLSSNLLTTIQEGLFNSAMKLEILNLNNNSLVVLPDNIFVNCMSLQELSVSKNNLSSLPHNSFSSSQNSVLRKVDFSHNNLNSSGIFKSYVFSLNNHLQLEDIDFSYNNFTKFPSDAYFSNFLKLKSLNFDHNIIREINVDSVLDLANNCDLSLRFNNIERAIYNREFNSNAVNVYLEGNKLICDCHLFKLVSTIHKSQISQLIYLTFPFNEQNSETKLLHVADAKKVVCNSPEELANQPLTDIDLSALTCQLVGPDCPSQCSCKYRSLDYTVIVDCSNQQLEQIPDIAYNNEYNYTLNMTGNNISNFNLANITCIRILSLVNNNLTLQHLNKDTTLPSNLSFLDLRQNRLAALDQDFLMQVNLSGAMLAATENPFVCDCYIRPFHNFIQNNYKKVFNSRNLTCLRVKTPLMDLTEEDVCPLLLQPMVLTSIGVVTTLLVLFAVLVTLCIYRYKTRLKVWLYTHQMCLWFITEDEMDVDKQYDAFISYSHEDEEFVNNILVPGLENGEPKYQVCLHYRDWVVGEFIQSQIMNSVHSSRRTLVVLSTNFIESVWGQMEFRVAHQQALLDKTNRVIVIVYGEMPPKESLDEELYHYVSMHTYLKWGDPRFWDSLRYAMPHPRHLLKGRQKKKPFVDKIELVNGHVKENAIRV